MHGERYVGDTGTFLLLSHYSSLPTLSQAAAPDTTVTGIKTSLVSKCQTF